MQIPLYKRSENLAFFEGFFSAKYLMFLSQHTQWSQSSLMNVFCVHQLVVMFC